MALYSRDAVTVSAVVATRPRADCSSMEGHTSLKHGHSSAQLKWRRVPFVRAAVSRLKRPAL